MAAVMSLDMVGYSALMSRNEDLALSCVKALEEILRTEIPAAGGRLVKLLGDGSLAEFPTAVSAVACARRMLERISSVNDTRPARERFQVRIGLHLGDLVDKEGDILGDAVNIAARVQALADPGGIAMTEIVHAQMRNHQVPLQGLFLSPQKLKNIPEKASVFLVQPSGSFPLSWRLKRRGLAGIWPAVALTAVAAVAVLGGSRLKQKYGPLARVPAPPAAAPPRSSPALPAAAPGFTAAPKPAPPQAAPKGEPAPAKPRENSSARLEVRVEGILDIGGEVGVAVFNADTGYPVHIEHAYEAQWTRPRQARSEAVLVFDSLPPGEYAVSVLHDEDGGRKMERNESGFPREGVGFSNDQKVVVRAPRFSESKFAVSAGGRRAISIGLDYSHRSKD